MRLHRDNGEIAKGIDVSFSPLHRNQLKNNILPNCANMPVFRPARGFPDFFAILSGRVNYKVSRKEPSCVTLCHGGRKSIRESGKRIQAPRLSIIPLMPRDF